MIRISNLGQFHGDPHGLRVADETTEYTISTPEEAHDAIDYAAASEAVRTGGCVMIGRTIASIDGRKP